jgi:alginate O-acetyltransferase complex protein AlgI
VIADNCAKFANEIFDNNEMYPGSMLLLGAVFFYFEIYCDFYGYSDIALGSARLLGIELLQNFRYPYFSRDIAEFWRRWHISLSSWFRDYLYVPLGGSKRGVWISIRNTFIIFTVSGFWHGANWTFIVWGVLNAIFFLPLLLTKRNRVHLEIVAHDRWLPTAGEFLQILVTFALTTLAWIFFRAENLTHAFEYLGQVFSSTLFVMPLLKPHTVVTMLLVAFMITVEWSGRRGPYALALMNTKMSLIPRWACYCILIFITLLFMVTEESPFIYFQF